MAIRTIGEENAVVFRNDSLYRELSVMYTTKAKLEDPAKRKAIVEFLRALAKTQEVFAKEPKKIWARVAKATGTNASAELLEKIWPFTRWTGGVPDDMVDSLTAEDQWATKDVTLKRGPMSRER
jgi:ABC-type nitrate/sulfonate/bicarbonate transport system substrate-binding protein